MKVLGIIPARGGSQGVKNKNIKPLNGKPLIEYSIDAAADSKLYTFIVSTDDVKIKEVAENANALVPFLRPNELASDTAKSIDVAVHALEIMENMNKTTYDAIMLLQPTAPFRTSADIDACIDLMEKNPSADSVISVVDVNAHHPARMKYLEDGWLIDPDFCEKYENQNRQELRPMFLRNGAIYLTKRDTLLNKSYKGNRCLAYEMEEVRSVNIDTMFDFELAEWLHKKL
jgi:CMP-N,N'-diacetyllegionaminic acid synthase